jgi:hypothetical protein
LYVAIQNTAVEYVTLGLSRDVAYSSYIYEPELSAGGGIMKKKLKHKSATPKRDVTWADLEKGKQKLEAFAQLQKEDDAPNDDHQSGSVPGRAGHTDTESAWDENKRQLTEDQLAEVTTDDDDDPVDGDGDGDPVDGDANHQHQA